MKKDHFSGMDIDALERAMEVNYEKKDELSNQFRDLGKRLNELPRIIKSLESHVVLQKELVKMQREKLIYFNLRIGIDSTFECVTTALESDIQNRETLLKREQEDLLIYKAEYEENAAIYEDTRKDMSAIDVLLKSLQQSIDIKKELPATKRIGA